MHLPGFFAEASLGHAAPSSNAPRRKRSARRGVRPADYVDYACYNGCYGDCLNECFATGGKGACVRMCQQESAECKALCTHPGSPPGTPTPAPSVTTQCTSGAFQYP